MSACPPKRTLSAAGDMSLEHQSTRMAFASRPSSSHDLSFSEGPATRPVFTLTMCGCWHSGQVTLSNCRLPTRSSPGRKTQCLGICRERVRPCRTLGADPARPHFDLEQFTLPNMSINKSSSVNTPCYAAFRGKRTSAAASNSLPRTCKVSCHQPGW